MTAPRKLFVLEGKLYFLAENIEDAFLKLGRHFMALADDAAEAELLAEPRSDWKVHVAEETPDDPR